MKHNMCRCIAVVTQGLVADTITTQRDSWVSLVAFTCWWDSGLKASLVVFSSHTGMQTLLHNWMPPRGAACWHAVFFSALSRSIVAEPEGGIRSLQKVQEGFMDYKMSPKTAVLKAVSSKWVKTSKFGCKICHLAKLKVCHAALACVLPLGLVITVLKTWLTGPPVPWPS